MNKPLISIIIPHYDIPDLLIRCLDSIPVSEDIQVIVVDDNSPHAELYQEYYPEFSRPYLEFIRTTKGGGAGYARNVGIDHARGKWLLFADADDLFVDDMYSIVEPYISSAADIIFFKKKSVLSTDINKPIERISYLEKYIDEYLETGFEDYIRYRHTSPWAKMIKREFVEKYKFRFDEVPFSNDYYFSVCIGYYAKQIKAVNRVLYLYTFRKDSLSGTFCLKPGELKVRAEVSFRVEKLFKQFNVSIDQETPFKFYLYKMLRYDRKLFRYYYYYKLTDIYTSIPAALQSLCKGKGLIFAAMLYSYSIWLWVTKWFRFFSPSRES